jgi:zinc-finger of transposase IS204/IS1001/IS1096/IS1165
MYSSELENRSSQHIQSFLYHELGIRSSRHVRTQWEFGVVVMEIELPPETCWCSQCGSNRVHFRGTTSRLFRSVSIGRKPVFVELTVPRLYCSSRHAVRQPRLGFADPKKPHTRVFARSALELSQFMRLTNVARIWGSHGRPSRRFSAAFGFSLREADADTSEADRHRRDFDRQARIIHGERSFRERLLSLVGRPSIMWRLNASQ